MTPKTKKSQAEMNEAERMAAWLKDAKGAGPSGDALTDALDALYAAGPAAAATARATARLRGALAQARTQPLYYDVAAGTPIGPVFVAVSERGLVAVRFGLDERAFTAALRQQTGQVPQRSAARAGRAARQVAEYLAGRRTRFDVPVDLSASSAFQREVLLAACQIPRGQVSTYAALAARIGRPKAARAVGQALSRNPVPIVVPCHRVLAADGSLRGYLGSAGTATKERLLRLEGAWAAG
jgi:methylated-DNA-[protein]-cysteine S-methyltransferase